MNSNRSTSGPSTTNTTTKRSTTSGLALSLFPLLSSHDVPVRIDAALSLLTSLPYDTATTADDVETPYAIKRLVNGLASSNEASRQGFAVALTELLTRLPTELSTPVLPLIIASSTAASGTDSKEERELLFARLLGLHAVIRSGILFRVEPTTTGESFKEVILALLALAGRKSWMREPAYWTMINAVKALLELEGESHVPEWREEMMKWCLQRLINDSREKAKGFSAEKVALVLTLQTYGVEADYATILSPTFPTGNPLSRASLPSLAQALKGTTGEIETASGAKGPKLGSNAVKTGTRGISVTPGGAPHFVWSEIYDIYFPEEGKPVRQGLAGAKEGRAKWHEVWNVLIDQSLFAPTSLSLKSTGFALLSLAIQRLPPFEIPALFGEGVMRTLSNHLRKSGDAEKTLARVADKVAASLPPFLAINPSVTLPLLKALIAPPHGSISFDPKTIERIVAQLDIKGVRGWIKYLKELILGEQKLIEDGDEIEMVVEEDEKTVTGRRVWAFDQLLHIIKAVAVPKDDEILAGLLEFFAVLGWFQVRKSGKGARSYIPTPAFTESLNLAARSRFFSVLTSLPHVPSTPTGQTWTSRALALLDNLSADDKHFNLIDEIQEEVVEARKEIVTMYKKLTRGDERHKNVRVLIEGVLLISYDEGEEALDALEQLGDCVSNLFPDLASAARTAAAAKEVAEDNSDDEGEVPESATVLVDLLLELLHRPSAFVKGIAQTVFTGFANEIGEQAMDLLLDQIRPEEIEVAEEEEEGEAADVDTEMVNGDATASTSKTVNTNGKPASKKKPATADSSDLDSSDDDDDEDSDDDAEVDEAFRNELLAALEANGVSEAFDAAEANDEGDDAEEELLNDDQMMALDEKLADIFRLQGGGKGKKAARTDDLHYRLRVVDLIDSLVKQRSANPLLVLVILPLFSIAQRAVSVEQELQSKATKLLRLIVSSRKDAPAPSSPQSALDALTDLLDISKTVDSPELANLCSQACIFLVKSALASPTADATTSTTIATLYAETFETYLAKKNTKTRVQPSLTIEFCRRVPGCAWGMMGKVIELASGEAGNAFRRMQAFEVVQSLLTNYAALKSDASKTAILAVMPSLRSAIYSVFSLPLTDTTTSFDSSRLKELGKIALSAVRITLSSASSTTSSSSSASSSTSASITQTIWKAEEFEGLIEGYKTSERFKGAVAIQNLLRQLVGLVATSVVVVVAPATNGTTKRKGVEEGVKEKGVKKSKKEIVVEANGVNGGTVESTVKQKKKDGKKEKKMI